MENPPARAGADTGAHTGAGADDSLVQVLPELVAFVRRDGVVIRELGGRRLGLPASGELCGRGLAEVWPAEVATVILQTIRRVLRDRSAAEVQFALQGRRYEARIAAQGRDRVLCVFRDLPALDPQSSLEGVRGADRMALERRAFHEQFKQSVADATLRERPLAICLLHLQGLSALGRALDFSLVDELAGILVARLPRNVGPCRAYIGRLGEHVLGAVLEDFPNRESLRTAAAQLCDSLAQPAVLGDASFSVNPSAGIATLGQDAGEARPLLENARAAMQEARRNGGGAVQFYSGTLRLRSLARLDVEQELRSAINLDQLALRYAARYDLETDGLVAAQAYLHWPHPLRGEVAAAEFLPIADSTGQAVALSRWAMQRWQRDLPALRVIGSPGMKFSFGPLRQHLVSGLLAADLADVLQSGAVSPDLVEIRIAEQALAGLANPAGTLKALVDLGVNIVIDEFGRGATALLRLARLPIGGLQIDRSLAAAALGDTVARKASAAALAVAAALDLKTIAAGVDSPEARRLLLSLGCAQGLGDCFGYLDLGSQVMTPLRLSA